MKTEIAIRVQKHRDHLRASGLRPIQIWIPDVRRKGFAQECRRQSLLLKNDPHEKDALDWIESTFDGSGWV